MRPPRYHPVTVWLAAAGCVLLAVAAGRAQSRVPQPGTSRLASPTGSRAALSRTLDDARPAQPDHATPVIAERPVYRDPGRPIEERIEDLLGRMTLEEKVGQMNMPCVYEDKLGTTTEGKMAACLRFAEGTYEPGLGPGGGFFTLANTILPQTAGQQAEYFSRLQHVALERTRLGIPLLQSEEGTHGLMASDATIFPEGPALGSTWNLDLLARIYATAAREARARGIHQLYTLVVEPNRDPRLGRNQEGFSEDPFLCARIAQTIVESAQGRDVSQPDRVVAGLCHYPGQSQPVSGLERGSMEISTRTLYDVFLPPWVASIRKAGALGVMATYPAIDGIPVHASSNILTHILREELGFQGLVLSEGGGIGTLIYEGLAPDMREAGRLALEAGVDVGISYEDAYIPMALVDRAVRRILRQKFRLGLFEQPYADTTRAVAAARTAAARDLALQAAREGIVLLRNDAGVLPLRKDLRTIAVIGPNADDARNQLGDYTPKTILHDIVTVLEGIRTKLGTSARVTYVKGCDVLGEGTDQFAQAVSAARGAEVAVVVVGENHWQADGKAGTDGEGFDSATLELTGRQEELVRAVQATGTPTIVVLINGRPLAIRWIAANVPAIVEAWLPGERGGDAVADVLFGDVNPSGRLAITVPRHAGQLPVYYDSRPSKRYWIEKGWGTPYADLEPTPLYDFGFGLSYTRFGYTNLRVTPATVRQDGEVTVEVDLQNTGTRAGAEVVQLYLGDPIASVSRPPLQLRGFQKVALEPTEQRAVRFTLGPEDLAMLDATMQRVVEPGVFEVMIGRSSRQILLTARFEVAGR